MLQSKSAAQTRNIQQSSSLALNNNMPVCPNLIVLGMSFASQRGDAAFVPLMLMSSGHPQCDTCRLWYFRACIATYLSGPPESHSAMQDEGGVTKEFFQILVHDLFNENYGMFVYRRQTRTFWFNMLAQGMEPEFELVGIVIGLAIYNGVILDVHFPLVVYKKLLNQDLTLVVSSALAACGLLAAVVVLLAAILL